MVRPSEHVRSLSEQIDSHGDERDATRAQLNAYKKRIEEFRTALTKTLRFMSKVGDLLDGTPQSVEMDALSDEIFELLKETL